MTPTAPPSHGATLNQILFFLRFIQQGSIVLTGFIALYFTYWHILLRDVVPGGLILLIAACTITFLESYLSSAITIYTRRTSPDFFLNFETSALPSLFQIAGYNALRKVPFVTKWCEGDNWFKPTRYSEGYTLAPAGVEEHHCALTCVIIVCGAVALGATLAITAFSAGGWMMEKGPWKAGYRSWNSGYREVDNEMDDDSLYSDETLPVRHSDDTLETFEDLEGSKA